MLSSQSLVLVIMFLIPERGSRSAVVVPVVLMGQECRTSAFPRC